MVSAVIVAAGSGTRMGAGINKVFLKIGGKTIIEHTVGVFLECPQIGEIIIVTDDEIMCRKLFPDHSVKITAGGRTRRDSVINGLKLCSFDYVAIHDGARALIKKEDIEKAISAAKTFGAAAVGVKCKDTLKKADADGFIEATLDRESTYLIQTPQVFKTAQISDLQEKAVGEFTDDCSVLESFGIPVKIVSGSYDNIKITTPDDLITAEKILEKRKNK